SSISILVFSLSLQDSFLPVTNLHSDNPSYSGHYNFIYCHEMQNLFFILWVAWMLYFHCPLYSVS
ncbi:unnamed protein product, partial [Bubo scandiacus]